MLKISVNSISKSLSHCMNRPNKSIHFSRTNKRLNSTTTSSTNANTTIDKLGIVVFTTISLFAGGLGVWQLQRYTQKVDKIANIKDKIKLDPIIIPSNINQIEINKTLNQNKNQKVSFGKGKFLHSNEILVGPRSAPHRAGSGAQG